MEKELSFVLSAMLVLSVSVIGITVDGRDLDVENETPLAIEGEHLASEKDVERDVRTEPYNYTKDDFPAADLNAAGVNYTNLTYRYDNRDKNLPREAILYLNGTHADMINISAEHLPGIDEPMEIAFKPIVNITVDRPDGRSITLMHEKVTNSHTFGSGGKSLEKTTTNHKKAKNSLYEFGKQFYEPYLFDKKEELTLNLNETSDTAGNTIDSQKFSWFVGEEIQGDEVADKGHPEIISAYPSRNVTGFPTHGELVIQFSEEIDTDTFNYTLTNTGILDISVSVSWDDDNTKVTLDPYHPNVDDLWDNQTYRFTIEQAEDLDGNDLNSSLSSFNFTTPDADVKDTIDPKITQIYPPTERIIHRDQQITITFSESVEADTFDFNYTQEGVETTKEGVYATWNEKRTVVKIRHDSTAPPSSDIRPARVLFGRANDEILSQDPDELKGTYYFNVSIIGADVELEFGENDTRMLYVRDISSGDEKSGFISVYWWLIPAAVISIVAVGVIAAIVRRKKRPPTGPEYEKEF